jgi:hypothetical protein
MFKGERMRLVQVLAAALLTVAALQTSVSLAQLPPTRFYGTVLLNGEVPPPDTVVEAYVGDVLCGAGIVQDLGDPIGMGYLIDVFADAVQSGCGTDGVTVTFRVAGVLAYESGGFQTGSFVQLDLSADGEPAPPPSPAPEMPPVTEPEQPPAPEPQPQPEPEPEPAPEG